MKCKRLASLLLAGMLLIGCVTGGSLPANAADEKECWTKTDPFTVPLVGRYIAWPGEQLLVKQVLPQLVNSLVDLKALTNDLYTDDTINALIQLEAGILIETNIAGSRNPVQIRNRPAQIANSIKDEPYATEYKENLAALSAMGDGDNCLEGFDDAALTWGVHDKDSFLKVAGLVLRPLLRLLCIPDLGFITEGGAYETAVLPALEALGCENLVSREELENTYKAHFKDAKYPANGMFAYLQYIAFSIHMERLVDAIVRPLLDLVEEIAADPVGQLLERLPNIIYRREAIEGLFDVALSMPGGDPIKLFDEILGAPIDGLDGLLDLLLGDPPLLKLPPIDWDALAHAGKLDLATNTVKADTTVVYGVLLNYVSKLCANDPAGVTALLGQSVPAPLDTLVFWALRAALWLLLL
ncbi:MAG: hypothetical protein LBB50_00235 [Oscillospiraceae bacterium]|jgi:hypothetical protein|nr:hypothetical protein [Oscillospiraceae bacterium]